MNAAPFLSPAEASAELGVSPKALRLYEKRGLVTPVRTAAGWRAYGAAEMARLTDIVALRALGLSLAQVARILSGEWNSLEPALAAHQAALEGKREDLVRTIERVRDLRAGLTQGQAPATGDLAGLLVPGGSKEVSFDLPWPWGGERFVLRDVKPLTYIIGPLGSGKTRLAMRIAETIPGALFLGLDRRAQTAPALSPAQNTRIGAALAWLTGEGATPSDALNELLAGIESEATAIAIDMIEQGLDQATQEALIVHLRNRTSAPPLFLLTRSNVILNLEDVGPREAIILCPANHAPPSFVTPYPGTPGYEGVSTCLAPPAVRARTEGMIAWHPRVA